MEYYKHQVAFLPIGHVEYAIIVYAFISGHFDNGIRK